MLTKLIYNDPYWTETEELEVEVREYKFDKEFCDSFSTVNCFTKAIHNEGRILSFIHENYKNYELNFTIHNADQLIKVNS
jgi:hypothetical protein